jgi:hypothetical protein
MGIQIQINLPGQVALGGGNGQVGRFPRQMQVRQAQPGHFLGGNIGLTGQNGDSIFENCLD